MVRIIFTLVIYLVSQLIGAQIIENQPNQKLANTDQIKKTETYAIKVTVPNISNNRGQLIVVLYSSSESFYKRTPDKALKAKIKDGQASVVFEELTPGEYAIVCLHDMNLNERMDFDNSGMPLEDYGLSNNNMRMGPPNYNEAKFNLENNSLDLSIRF